MSHDLDKEANEFLKKYDKPIELTLRRLEQDKHSLEGTQRHMNELAEIVLRFMNHYHYNNYDDEDECCDDIEKVVDALDIQLTSGQLNYLESCIAPQVMKKSKLQQQTKQQAKQTKRQEVAMYPPRFTTSKPIPPQPMTNTIRPKLNLKHMKQAKQPASVSPGESTRKPNLSMSLAEHHGRNNKLDYSFGVVSGVESDNRIFNSELKSYKEALKHLKDNNMINALTKRTGIHATNDARAAVRELVKGRLTAWR